MSEQDYNNMGPNASRFFSGTVSDSDVIDRLFNQSASLFADVIRKSTTEYDSVIALLDIGSYKGEFATSIISMIKDKSFVITAVDSNSTVLAENKIALFKVEAPAYALPLLDKTYDVSIMRYVLHWNSWENQKKILSEAIRVTKGIFIVQHLGSDVVDNFEWNKRMQEVVGGIVPKLYRPDAYFSSSNEIEEYVKEFPVSVVRLQNRRIEKPSIGYQKRFDLSDSDFRRVQEILGDKDYIMQTTWLISRKED